MSSVKAIFPPFKFELKYFKNLLFLSFSSFELLCILRQSAEALQGASGKVKFMPY